MVNPIGLGLPMISYVSNDAFVLHNVSQETTIDHLQINLSRNQI